MSSAAGIFKKLSRIGGKLSTEDEKNSHDYPDTEKINAFMCQALSEKGRAIAHYINLTECKSDVYETVREVAKHISDRSKANENGAVNDDYSDNFDEPFVFLSYTKHNSTPSINLWNSWVLLPKSFKSLGSEIKRENFGLFVFSVSMHKDFVSLLKKHLTSESNILYENGSFSTHSRFPFLCKEDEIEVLSMEIKQLHDSDSGWWACYCSLMTVYYGNASFYDRMKGNKYSSAPLRSVIPIAAIKLVQMSVDSSDCEIDSNKRESYKCSDAHNLGSVYELSLTMFVIKRACELGLEFKVATEKEDDGKFDDLSIEFLGNRGKKYYIQAKYRDNEHKKINYGNLKTEKGFRLNEYFASYCVIEKNKVEEIERTENPYKREILKNFWDESRFIICTTIGLDEDDLKSHSITVTKVADDVNSFFNSSKVTLMKCYRLVIEDEACKKLFLLQEGEKNLSQVKNFLTNFLFIVTLKGEPILKEIRKEIEKKHGMEIGKNIYTNFHNGVWEWMSYGNDKGIRFGYNTEINPYREAEEYYLRSVQFDLNEPVHSFVGREHELDTLHKQLFQGGNEAVMIVQQQVIVSGLGGIGKSELARKYAHNYRQFYNNNVIWINAEKGSISESFESLAEHLKIDLRNVHGGKKSIEQIINEVYIWFMHKTCLFIFDNAEEYRDIVKYLPKVHENRKKPYVLVTTRNRELFNKQEHGQIGRLELDVLSKENAVEFVKKTLKISDQDEEIIELVELLGCLPLALQHAVAYIRESNFERNIKNFLELYKDGKYEAKKLFERKGLDSYSATIFMTYRITMEKIKLDPISLEILYLISFFAPDNIPKELFLKLPQLTNFQENQERDKLRSKEAVNCAINLLQKYSMVEVNADGTVLSIHRLLQQVIRLYVEDEECNILSKAITLMNNCDRWGGYQSHLASIWRYFCFQSKLIDGHYFKNSLITSFLHSFDTSLHRLACLFSLQRYFGFLWKATDENYIQNSLITNTLHSRAAPLHLIAGNGSYEKVCYRWGGYESHLTSIWRYSSFQSKLIDEHYFKNSLITTYLHSSATPLHLLAQNGSYEEVDSLLNYISTSHSRKKSTVIEALDKYNRTPLYLAAENDNLKVVELLVKNGASTNIKSTMYYPSKSTRLATGWTPLFIATFNGCFEVVKYLVNKCKNDINVKDSLGRIPAVLAAHSGNVEIVKFLTGSLGPLEKNKYLLHAEIQYPAIRGKTQRLLDFLNGLDEHGKEKVVNSTLGEWTPLNLVASKGYYKITKILLKNGAVCKRKGFTPLHSAASRGKLKVAKLLMKNGADPNDVDDAGWTSLHGAAQNGHLNVVRYFIEKLSGDKCIDISIQDFKKDTPLHTAAFHGNLDVVEYLIDKGAEINICNKWGATPLIHACFSFNKDVVIYLLERQDVIICPIENNSHLLLSLLNFTPLHIAAAYGDIDIVKILVERRNMDVDIGKNEWCTPLHIAAVFGNPEVIDYLLSKGADIDAVAQIKKFSEVLEALKVSFKDFPRYSNILRYIGYVHTFTKYFISWSYYFRFTANACSKSLGHNEHLLEGGSEEQGYLPHKFLSSEFAKSKLQDFKFFMERFKEKELSLLVPKYSNKGKNSLEVSRKASGPVFPQ